MLSSRFRGDTYVLDPICQAFTLKMASILRAVYTEEPDQQARAVQVLQMWGSKDYYESSTIERWNELMKGTDPLPEEVPEEEEEIPPWLLDDMGGGGGGGGFSPPPSHSVSQPSPLLLPNNHTGTALGSSRHRIGTSGDERLLFECGRPREQKATILALHKHSTCSPCREVEGGSQSGPFSLFHMPAPYAPASFVVRWPRGASVV